MTEPEVQGLMMGDPMLPPYGGGGVSLKEHIEAILRERDTALHTLAESQERALKALAAQQAQTVATLAEATEREVQTLAAAHAREVQELKANVLELARLHAEAHEREHGLAQTAVEKAEVSVNDRLVEMNKTFLARLDALAAASALTKETVMESISELRQKNANMDGRFLVLGGVLGVLILVAQFVGSVMLK